MAERFEQLYKFPENLYTEDAPIIIAAGALLKDNVTGSIVAQFKFHSISIKTIKALKISIDALDVAGQPLQNIEDYQYLDLSIRNGQDFGANKAIVMPSPVTRAISIANFTVVFSDNSKWGWDSSNELTSLPHLSNLRSMLHDAEMEKQYQISTNQYAKYVPCESGSLWSCACGEWNNTDYCTKCRLSKTTAFSALDISTLQTNMENRLAAEKAKREMEMEQQRIAAEKEAAKKAENEKKRKVYIKYGTIAAIVAAVILIIVGIISAVIAKNRDLTIDKLLTLETREDVISLLGKSDDSETEDSYDVTFMRNDYYMIVKYNDDSIDHCTLTYDFPGMANIELAVDMLEYEPTSKDISVANNLVDELLNTFNEKFGEPEVFNSPVSTTTYTWIVDSNEIELVNYIGNDELSLIGAIDIRINYNTKVSKEQADASQSENENETEIESEQQSTLEIVKKSYDNALSLAKSKNKDQDYSYVLLHDEVVKLSQATTFNEADALKIFNNTVTSENIKEKCSDLLVYVIEENQDYISALMRKFSALESVAGTIETKKVNIQANDVDKLLNELGIQPETLGRILAMLDIYDYSWLSDSEDDKFLKFTDDGFTYNWSAVGDKTLDLNIKGSSETTKSPSTNENNKTTEESTTTNKKPTTQTTGCSHDYGQYAIDEATCLFDGVRYMKCTKCGDSYEEVIKALGHSWKDATCTQAEYCTNCGETKGAELGHNWPTNTVNPQCSRCYQPYDFNVSLNIEAPKSITAHNGVEVTISNVWYELRLWGQDEYRLTVHVEGTSTDHFMMYGYTALYSSNGTEIDDILGVISRTDVDANGNFSEWFSYDIPASDATYTFIVDVWK